MSIGTDGPIHINGPNKVRASDIMYFWTEEGWLYPSAIPDLFSRQIVGGQSLIS